jgi:hypothetical protein
MYYKCIINVETSFDPLPPPIHEILNTLPPQQSAGSLDMEEMMKQNK